MVAGAALFCGMAAQALGASTDPMGQTEVLLSDQCEHSVRNTYRISTNDGEVITVSGASVFLGVLANFVGDVAGAGLNALGSALDEASREKAFGAEGRTNFEFYTIDPSEPELLRVNAGGSASCLILTVYEAPQSRADAMPALPDSYVTDPQTAVISKPGGIPLNKLEADALIDHLENDTREIKFRIESELVAMDDGFYLRPIYIDYRSAFAGAPRRREIPAELHVTFATVGSVSDSAAKENLFGIARIPLPELRPGMRLWEDQLDVVSEILPFRPTSGSPAAVRTKFAGASTVRAASALVQKNSIELAGMIGLRMRSGMVIDCIPVSCAVQPGERLSVDDIIALALIHAGSVSEEQKAALETTIAASAASLATLDTAISRFETDTGYSAEEFGLIDRWAYYGDQYPTPDTGDNFETRGVGSTSIKARIVLTRSANKFGQAIADALTKQADPLSQAVSGAITRDTPEWTQAMSDYKIAELDVTHKQNALNRAKAATELDPSAIEAAEAALLLAKTTANLRAAAVDQAIPYPGI